jgi:DNA/RNA endonuclease G (NUC1)
MLDSLFLIIFSTIVNCNTCVHIDSRDYQMLYDTAYQIPNLTVYSIDNTEKNDIVERGNWLESEKHLGINTPDYDEHFYKTGYDRGHLVPLDNMKYSQIAMNRACLDINMTKQNASFNRGTWREIEEDVTEIIEANNYTLIITGVVYDKTRKEIPPIPIYYYKLAYDTSNWYYWLCENKKGQTVKNCISNYNDIVEKISIYK